MKFPSSHQGDPRKQLRFLARQSVLDIRYGIAVGNGSLMRMLQTPRVQILYTHDVPDSCLPNMRMLFQRLVQTCTFVSYDVAVARIGDGRIDRPLIAIALDDGFAVSDGLLSLFDDFGIRACFFVIGDTLDFGADQLRSAALCRTRLGMPPRPFLDWRQIETLQIHGHQIGAHTMSHPDLTVIPVSQAQDEIAASHDLLIQRMGRCDHLAWPYGRTTAALTEFAVKLGFLSLGMGRRGHYVQKGDIHQLWRDAWYAEEPPRNILTLMLHQR
jgi:peptidoglycan/xylan/chitin deacetylase (PgdA/CDA1 family)